METLETIEYRGFTINVHPDYDASNPFTEFDCEPTILFKEYRGGRSATYGDGAYRTSPERADIIANADKICAMLGESSLFAFRETASQWEYSVSDTITELIEDYANEGTSEFVEVLNMLGTPADYISGASRDGDAIAILTPEFFKESGCDNSPESNERILTRALELFENWATGSTYGYTVSDPDGEETDASCWSFYGWDHDKSGLLEHAKSDIDHQVRMLEEEEREAARRLAESTSATYSLFPNYAQFV